MTARESSENKIQSQIFLWHWNSFPSERGLIFEVSNNPVNAIDGARRKAIGMVAGVSDLIYLHPSGCIGLEIKTPSGRQGKKQAWWQSVVEANGYRYFILRSLDDFKELHKSLSVK